MKILLVSLLAAYIAFTGCSSTTSPNSVVIPKSIVPGPGSWWRFVDQYRDSTNTLVEVDSFTTTVHDTGLSIGGKTGVIRIGDSSYRYFESNGDVSVYSAGISAGRIWYTLPFGSQGSIEISGIENGPDVLDSVYYIYTGAGTGSFTFKGRTYVTTKLLLTSRSKQLPNYDWVLSPSQSVWQFAPEIGTAVLEDRSSYRDPRTGKLQQSYHHELIDYQLK